MLVSKNDKNINVFDKRDSMYPSYGLLIGNEHFVKASEIGWATMFGYSEFTCQIQIGETVHHLGKNNYFSLVTKNNDVLFKPISNSIIFVVFRLGFIGVNLVGELDVEKPGKLSYIDGCSDSMLVYPPRFGDPNLRVRNNNPGARKSFRARHKCDQKHDKTKAGYWACNVARYRKKLGIKSSSPW